MAHAQAQRALVRGCLGVGTNAAGALCRHDPSSQPTGRRRGGRASAARRARTELVHGSERWWRAAAPGPPQQVVLLRGTAAIAAPAPPEPCGMHCGVGWGWGTAGAGARLCVLAVSAPVVFKNLPRPALSRSRHAQPRLYADPKAPTERQGCLSPRIGPSHLRSQGLSPAMALAAPAFAAATRVRVPRLAVVNALLFVILAAASSEAAFNCKGLGAALHKGLPFTGCEVLKPSKAVLQWQDNGDFITLRLTVRERDEANRGWFALGISDMGGMTGADIAVVHRKGGRWAVTDAKAYGFRTPEPDDTQDWRLHSASLRGARFTAVLSRSLKTCDTAADHEIRRGMANFFIFANGPAAGDWISYHGQNRGSLQLQLLGVRSTSAASASAASAGAAAEATGPAPAPAPPIHEMLARVGELLGVGRARSGAMADAAATPVEQLPAAGALPTVTNSDVPSALPKIVRLPDGSFYADVLCKVPKIPAVETTYMTCYVEMPSDKRYHVTKYTTIYGHRLVHHSLVYACLTDNAQPKVEQLLRTTGPGPYNQKDMRQVCEAFYMVGPAPNVPTYTFPAGTGLPVGKGSYKYLAIEVHYNNPTFIKGESDPGTGLRVYFQEAEPATHEIGILTISQFVLDIPASQSRVFTNRTTCMSDCTNRLAGEVTMIGQALHMHGLGRSIYTRRVDNAGMEQPPLATLNDFDYNFQTWIDIPDDGAVLKPGEELSLQCVFDSTSRKKQTSWGEGTQDEMCFWWIYYYPAQAGMGICTSLGDTPLTVCTDSVTDLIDMDKAVKANDTQKLNSTILGALKATRAILGTPMTVIEPYNASKGCSATPPPR